MSEEQFIYQELTRLSKNITLLKNEIKEINKKLKKAVDTNEILMNQYDIKFIIDGKDYKLMSAIVQLIKKTEIRETGEEGNG